MSETLEFSLQDLGRLAAAIDQLEAITEWVRQYAPSEKIAEDATAKVRAGYDEEMPWFLVRPGVRLAGHWMPDLFDYPFRFEGPKVGDEVYVIIRNRDTKEFKIAVDRIVEVTDYADNCEGEMKKSALIDYWIDQYNPGHGLTFGDVLFETKESAQQILNDIETNLDKWDGCDGTLPGQSECC